MPATPTKRGRDGKSATAAKRAAATKKTATAKRNGSSPSAGRAQPAAVGRSGSSRTNGKRTERRVADVAGPDLLVLDIPQTADVLGISTKTVRRLIADGELPAKRVGGQLRILRTALLRYLGA